mgnify:CR=1 FL=1
MAATNLSMSNSTTVKATSTNACNGVVLRSSDGIDVVTGWSVYANTQANPEGNGFTHCDLTTGTSIDRASHGLSFGSTGRSGKPIAVNGISLGSALTGLQYPGLNFGKAGWKAIRTEWKAFLEGRPDMIRRPPTWSDYMIRRDRTRSSGEKNKSQKADKNKNQKTGISNALLLLIILFYDWLLERCCL